MIKNYTSTVPVSRSVQHIEDCLIRHGAKNIMKMYDADKKLGSLCFIMPVDGKEILLDNLSGGQKVWCLMALRLAMTLLSKEKSGKNFETFFSDEMDGALDPENALNFVNMYRSFMQAGGFKDGYFISHKPSCRALADNNLMFEAGSSPAWQ